MRTLLASLALAFALSPLSAADIAVPATGTAAFHLTIPAGWSAQQVDAKTIIATDAKHPHIQVWATDAADVAAAEKAVAKIIESEVTHFTATKTEELTVAGSKAVALIGTGEEADDGDPSLAEATFFTFGGKVYVLLAHGEGDGAAKQRANLRTALASLK